MIAVAEVETDFLSETIVGRKKKTEEQPPTPPKVDPPKRIRARDRGEVISLNVEISPDLDAAIDECRDELHWSRKTFITIAIQQLLSEKGHWPRRKPKGGGE